MGDEKHDTRVVRWGNGDEVTQTASPDTTDCSTVSEREPLSWIVPIIECDDLELQTISALGGVMRIFESRRPVNEPHDQETVRRMVTWFADKYGGIRIR